MLNQKAFQMIEGRFSDHVKMFNSADVSGDDSDTHYWIVKDKLELARVALERAPQLRVTTLPRSLGDVYQAVRKNLTAEELARWDEKDDALHDLCDKYGI
ncbi:hypothetical protein ACGFZC_16035 [[Kitasatospora] papulosa]|uniref:hypothetical protein n=1 Tax=[Kitasatospora] papulosa TaxID=1464011 RepID=UPI0037199530